MFRECLLESSSALRRRKRWTMAAAFAAQSIAAAALIIVPLLTTGVIQLRSAVPIFVPKLDAPITHTKPATNAPTHGGTAFQPAQQQVVEMADTHGLIDPLAKPRPEGPECVSNCEPVNLTPPGNGNGDGPPDFSYRYVPKKQERLRISEPSEAMLMHKVVPAYPQIAIRTGITGTVKLHALIARDGSIQSLSVISGHPLLAQAAIEAVQQWQYKPYMLNGEQMEVETYITVTFTRGN